MINNEVFKSKIEQHHPLSQARITYWKEEKRRLIEGIWAGGKWCPGVLYGYINHWKIEVNKTVNSKQKIIANPFLRDLEWEKAYIYVEARGFSGFEDDKVYTCDRAYKPYRTKDTGELITPVHPEGKTYVEARDYLRKIHLTNLGRPLYNNDAKNVIDVESRGTGKSFWGAWLVSYNFLTDGVMMMEEIKDNPTVEVIVGAIDSKYSNGLLKKVQLGLENLPGAIELNGRYYPPPLAKSHSGQWIAGKTILAEVEVNIGGNWLKRGSKSKIQHRTFQDNPFAANGTRPAFSILEEIGFFSNLLESLGAMKETTMTGANKFGTIWMTGTGGDMAGGATEAAKEVFYNPEGYDCLAFVDMYEGSSKPIGLFIPAYMGLNQFKDDQGVTNKEAALGYLLEERRKASLAKSKQPLNDELQNRPIVPSEAFLVTQGNVFPVADIQRHRKYLQSLPDGSVPGQKGTLEITETGSIQFIPDLENKLHACWFGMKEKDDTTGAVVIWEHPDPGAAYGYYVAGNDPYDLDNAPSSVSLGSTIIMKRGGVGAGNHDKIVAEYTARPETAIQFYENSRRLLLYYGAICLYENEKNQIKTYFTQKQSLHLLAYTPTVLKSNQSTTVNRVYGQHMPDKVKAELEIYTRDWLTAPAGEGKMNLHHIYSIPLLEELEAYNDEGNFDRVIALMLAVCQAEQFHHIKVKKKEEVKKDPFFTRRLFAKRR